MERYDTYKDSGVKWIGDIPSEWKLSKVKYESEIFGRIGYRGYTVDDIVEEGEGVITISPSNIFNDVFNLNEVTYLSFDKYFQSPEIMIFENDIILVKTGSTIGKTSIIPKGLPEMTLNPQLVVLKKIKLNSKFYYYQTICNYFKESFYIEQTGSSTPTISQEKINDFPLLLPSVSEQQKIVDFLDNKTSFIDSLIEKTQNKIELLKEQRTSLINHSVTKGLNPKVEMKDSGVEWIGEIPRHWENSKLKYHGNFFSGYSFDSNDFQSEGEVRVIKISNIQNNGVSWEDLSFLPKKYYDDFEGFRVLQGDLIFVLTRPIISTGIKVCFYQEEYLTLLNQRNSVFRPDVDTLVKRFLFFLVRTFYFFEEFKQQLKGTNQPNISTEQISNIKIYLPSLVEQQQIVEYLDEQTNIIDITISKEQKRIKLLKEYRQSLILEVVTGKIKITNE